MTPSQNDQIRAMTDALWAADLYRLMGWVDRPGPLPEGAVAMLYYPQPYRGPAGIRIYPS